MKKGYYGAWAGIIMLVLGSGCASHKGGSEYSAQKWLEVRWVMTVLTSAERGDSKLHVARWSQPVVVVAENGTEAQHRALVLTIEKLRSALDGVHEITLARSGTELAKTAQVRVLFVPQKDWPELGKKWNLPMALPDKGMDGFHFVRWNERSEIMSAQVVIGDSLDVALLEHTLLEELYQAMGIRNDSAFFSDSIVYESGGDTGGNTQLSARDKKLIRFLYQYVPPGTRPDALAKLIDKHWVYEEK